MSNVKEAKRNNNRTLHEKQKPKDIYIVMCNVHPDTGELKREDEDGVTER